MIKRVSDLPKKVDLFRTFEPVSHWLVQVSKGYGWQFGKFAPENRPKPKKKGLFPNHIFQVLADSFGECRPYNVASCFFRLWKNRKLWWFWNLWVPSLIVYEHLVIFFQLEHVPWSCICLRWIFTSAMVNHQKTNIWDDRFHFFQASYANPRTCSMIFPRLFHLRMYQT